MRNSFQSKSETISGSNWKLFLLLLCVLFGSSGAAAAEVKRSDLAGSWYVSDKKELAATVQKFIDDAPRPDVSGEILGIISPHAGYAYSGRIAGVAFKAVEGGPYKIVVIIGFSHRKFFNGISVYDRGSFQTPLGEVEVDADFAKRLTAAGKTISFYPDLFNDENSIEMIIPFAQVALKDAKIVPVAFGTQDYGLCEALARALAGTIKDRKDVLIIASSDMSHFHSYEEANAMDSFTIKKLQGLDPRGLYDEIRMASSELCGAMPVMTLMMTMKMLGADNVEVLKYENSGDVTGDKARVVGYMAAVFYKNKSQIPNSKLQINPKSQIPNKEMKEGEKDMLNEKQRKRLLEIARSTMEEYVKTGKTLEFTEIDPELLKEKGAFVTLHYKGDLRGCIGNIIGRGPLYKTVRDMAIESSTNDPRFPSVTAKELKDIKIEISVLSEPERVSDVNEIRMGVHGVIIKKGFRSGVFLPQVATETGWGREEFLNNLCSHKAGLPADAWKDPDTEIYSFSAEVFGEN